MTGDYVSLKWLMYEAVKYLIFWTVKESKKRDFHTHKLIAMILTTQELGFSSCLVHLTDKSQQVELF
jgi:hypothetical protein